MVEIVLAQAERDRLGGSVDETVGVPLPLALDYLDFEVLDPVTFDFFYV